MIKKLSYHKSVNYDIADPAKVMAQKQGLATTKNMPFGFSEVLGTRGESAYVFDMGSMYGAIVQEGLGTKSLIAQEVYRKTSKLYFDAIAQDTVATVINDLISVGATPVALNAYWSASSYDWLGDKKMTENFIKGWRKACDRAGVVWGGGETQSLPGVIEKNVVELAGCGFGVVKPKKNLIQDSNLKPGDKILLLESSGVHANGISMAREIAGKLKLGYQTKIPGGQTYGEALLAPTILYAKVLQEFFAAGLKIHYLSNVTGHGWRKLMRGTPKLTYIIENSPTPHPVFDFIQERSGNSVQEMYETYNMGVGYAVYLPEKDAIKAQAIAKKLRIKSWIAGHIEQGPKQVIIKDKNITFGGESLRVR